MGPLPLAPYPCPSGPVVYGLVFVTHSLLSPRLEFPPTIRPLSAGRQLDVDIINHQYRRAVNDNHPHTAPPHRRT